MLYRYIGVFFLICFSALAQEELRTTYQLEISNGQKKLTQNEYRELFEYTENFLNKILQDLNEFEEDAPPLGTFSIQPKLWADSGTIDCIFS